ncbi:MAG: ParA family protein, partial [Actinomycetes bacterium]
QVLGVVATIFDGRTRLSREIAAEVGDRYGLRLFEPPVPKSVRFAEAPALRRSILEHAPKSAGALAYRALALAITEAIKATQHSATSDNA